MTRLLSIEVRAKDGRRFDFSFCGDPGYVPEWRAAGLDVTEILNTIPEWFPWPRLWCSVQDLLHFKNPWGEDEPQSICPGCRWRSASGQCVRFAWVEPWAWTCKAFAPASSRSEGTRDE